MPNHHSRTTPRLPHSLFPGSSFTGRGIPRRAPLLRSALLALMVAGAATAGAQEQAAEPEPEVVTNDSWLDGVRAQCLQQYSMEQCQDRDFLNEKFHADSLQAAHRTAIQRRNQEERALRELLLQRACNNKKTYCAQTGTLGCAQQLAQMCTAIAQQATACLNQARQYCATFPQNAGCLKQRQAQCPSAKKQSIDALLDKYPKLSAQQQEHVRMRARQMDANLGNWVGDLFRWLGF